MTLLPGHRGQPQSVLHRPQPNDAGTATRPRRARLGRIRAVRELPSVCVIGAGVSGLTACKALGDFGVPYKCYEASDEVGGNWYFQNPNGVSSAYRSLHIDISKPSISCRDFPMPDRYPDYPHHTHIFEWLRDYADAFGLRDRIRFNTRVQHAERAAGGGWRITLMDGEREDFDALLVCNGHHWDPRFPDFPGK